jgi:hypothetical protein
MIKSFNIFPESFTHEWWLIVVSNMLRTIMCYTRHEELVARIGKASQVTNIFFKMFLNYCLDGVAESANILHWHKTHGPSVDNMQYMQ